MLPPSVHNYPLAAPSMPRLGSSTVPLGLLSEALQDSLVIQLSSTLGLS